MSLSIGSICPEMDFAASEARNIARAAISLGSTSLLRDLTAIASFLISCIDFPLVLARPSNTFWMRGPSTAPGRMALARNARMCRACSRVDENFLCRELADISFVVTQLNDFRPNESSCRENEIQRGRACEILTIHCAHRRHHTFSAAANGRPIHSDLAGANAKGACPPRRLRRSRARNQRLGGNAGDIDAGAADHLGAPLNQRRLDAFVSKLSRQRLPTLAAPEDDDFVGLGRVHKGFPLRAERTGSG